MNSCQNPGTSSFFFTIYRLVYMLFSHLLFLLLLIPKEANSSNCINDFNENLKSAFTQVHTSNYQEYTQGRLTNIYPQLYSLEIDPLEKLELTQTLELLELANNKKKLFSEFEDGFSSAYTAYVKKGRDPSALHDYFRSIARGDLDNSKQSADLILSSIDESKRGLFSKMTGIHSSHDEFWTNYIKPPEVETLLIKYSDHANERVTGFKVDSEALKNQKFKITQISRAMEDIHGVHMVSVPKAIERLNSNGFSIRSAEYELMKAHDGKGVSAPMIVVPEDDLLFDRISTTAKHEARHAYYATLREQHATSPFDISVQSINKKPLGEATGYQVFQSYEEVSTHSKDLMGATRTGNREILNLFKTKKTIPANQIFDLSFLDNKSKTVKKISEQTLKTATESLADIHKLKETNFSDVRDIFVKPSPEGYVFTFPVSESFLANITFSSKREKEIIKNFIDQYIDYQEAVKKAADSGVEVSAKVSKKGVDALNSAFSLAEEKLNSSIAIAHQTSVDADRIIIQMNRIFAGDTSMDINRYLELRNLISKPARRVTGLAIHDPDEYLKAIEAIQKKRATRK